MVVCILFKSSFLTNQSKSVTERVSTNHVVVWCHHHSTDHWSHLLTRVNILRYYHRECAAASNEHQSLLIIVRVVKCWSIFFIACMLYDVCMIVIVWYASVEAVSQHSVDGAVSSTLLSTDQWLTHHHTTLPCSTPVTLSISSLQWLKQWTQAELWHLLIGKILVDSLVK